MYEGFEVIDSDGHIAEPYDLWEKYLPEPIRSYPGRPRIWKSPDGFMTLTYEDLKWPSTEIPAPTQGVAKMHMYNLPGNMDPHARVKDMDLEGRDIDIIFATTGILWFWYERGPYGVQMCRSYNEWLADYCSAYPGRMRGVAWIPLYDQKEAIKELERAVKDFDMVGAGIPCTTRAQRLDERIRLDDQRLYQVYEKAQELDVPLLVHPGNGPQIPAHREVTGTWFESIMAGFPIQIQVAMTSIIAGGVMDEFPRLRWGFFEGGIGWIPAWVDMMQDFAENEWYNTSVPRMKKKPWDYAKSPNFFISSESAEPSLPYAIERMGDDHVLYSSDYGHVESDFPNSVKEMVKQPIPKGALRKILSGNARRLFHIR